MKAYLDYAATTPIKKEVFKAMEPYFKADFGNPSSIHSFGQKAREGIDKARNSVAGFLGAIPSEIIFTSGATESINLAILGLISNFQKEKPHIITSQFEHHAVLHTCEYIEAQSLAEVTYLKPNKDGLILKGQVEKAIRLNTRLVTIMYVNNEIGTIQPIREIGKMIEKLNEIRSKKIYFHTDAVQAIGYLNSKVQYLHVDLLSFSGHKIYAPKGIGGLYVKKGTPLLARIYGGGQELGLRPGTENVAGIVGLSSAIEILDPEKENKNISILRNYFIKRVLKEIPEAYLNGSRSERSPNNANIYFKYIEGESIVLSLDLEGVACSTGSACTSSELKHSHVIMSVYNDEFRAAGSIRFSFGDGLSKKELDYAVDKLKEVVERLRKISPYK